jgi:sortase A
MRLRNWIEVCAWAGGLSLLVLYGAARTWSEAARADGLESIRDARLASLEANDETLGNSEHALAVDQSLWSKQRLLAFAESAGHPGHPSGALRIPSLELAVPIYDGTSEINLNRGAAHIEGTAELAAQGNIGIAAHRDGFFRKLEAIAIDAEIYLDVGDRSLRYRVVEIGIVMPTDVHVLAPTEIPSITLVTCYPFYFLGNAPERYIVRAELTDV